MRDLICCLCLAVTGLVRGAEVVTADVVLWGALLGVDRVQQVLLEFFVGDLVWRFFEVSGQPFNGSLQSRLC